MSESTLYTKRYKEQEIKGKLKHILAKFPANSTNNVNPYIKLCQAELLKRS